MKRIVMSVDTGVDDAIAILVALKTTEALGVTTVFGNTTLEHATQNTLDILSYVNRGDVPVARGATTPLVAAPPPPSPIHGPSGLANVSLPKSSIPCSSLTAADFISQIVCQETSPVVLVSLSPLTNLALALALHPEITAHIEEIVLMGGSTSFGNVTPVAEFNVHADPEAASAVFNSGIPIRMCGLNITRRVDFHQRDLDKFRKENKTITTMIYNLLSFRKDRLKEAFGFDGVSLHDPCAIFTLTHPELFEFTPMNVQVELSGTFTRGMTVCDQRPGSHIHCGTLLKKREPANSHVVTRANYRQLKEAMLDTLLKYA